MEGKETLIEKEEKKEKKETVVKETEKKEEIKEEIKKNKEKKPKEKTNFKQVETNKKKEIKKFEEKEEKEEKEKKVKNIKKKLIIITILGVIIIILSTIFAFININNTNILKGVSIKGIDVSNLTKEEAREKLEKIYNEKLEKEIDMKYKEYETTIDPKLIETKYNIEDSIEKAFKIGKNNNIFISNFEILKTYIIKENIDVEMLLNEEIARQAIEDIGTKLPGIVVESSYYIEGNNLIIGKGSEGILIEVENVFDKIKEELNNIEKNQGFIEISVNNKKPEAINIDKIHEEIYTEVKDAYYTKDPFQIYPEEEGIDFDLEKAKKSLEVEDKQEYIIPLKITKPKITIDQIGTEAFPDKLSLFTTKYDASNLDRTTNLKLACQKLNGKVILSGETFSYNKTLGERTVAAGYRNGKIYENGEVVDGIGGGICQISSTLYNTVLMGNLEIIERRNHQFVTSYLPAGRDATVSYGTTDFKFKNTRKYPVRLVATVQNGIATVSMYGIKEEKEYTVTFNTKTISTIPFITQYIDDDSIGEGKEIVKRKGTNGLVTETYITKNLNGKVISQKLLSRDTYSAMSNIVIRGKGKVKEVIPEKKEEEEKPAEKPTEKPTEKPIEKPVNET